ncbi:hypothetical protein J4P02_27120 [Pseudomonas sp. NFXW11]|uniref:hypothetical protein n=1 Tax=Pseudomonas sp. NFXW11 TaxID=2819531 RepID=UPI003CFB5AE6
MTDARQTPSPEAQMLAHIREHSPQQPPAHLDALILSTARREAATPRPSLWQRWMQACQRPRYQLAFASLFGVALIIGLLQRTPEQYPQQAFAPAPAPVAPAPVAEMEPLARHSAEQAPAGITGALSAPAPAAPSASFAMAPQMEMLSDQAPADTAKPVAQSAKLAKRMAAPAEPRFIKGLNPQLREVLRLWEGGQSREAAELLLKLQATYPQEDLDARLQVLRRQ